MRLIRDYRRSRPLFWPNGMARLWTDLGMTAVSELPIVISFDFDRSSTVPSRKKLKGRDNPRVDGGVALHVFDWQSVAGDRLHTGRQRDASGTQSQAGRGPGRGSQHESPAILLHLGLGQCIEIANDGGP